MGLHRRTPPMSGRMTALWALASVRDSVVLEFGCMGHMNYGRMFLHRMGVYGGKIYSTHIGETDIAMGDWDRLHRAVAQIIEKDKPKAIFLLPSSVPEIIGTDLKAIAYELSSLYSDVKILPVSCGNFDARGVIGVEQVLLQLAEVFPKKVQKTDKPSFNIIGSTADLFNFQADAEEICRMMDRVFSMKPVCIMTSETSISDLEHMPSAHFNIVIRREGESAAKALKKRFEMPYLNMRPYGVEGTIRWIRAIENLGIARANADCLKNEIAVCNERIEIMHTILGRFMRMHPEASNLTLVGHADVVYGISAFTKSLSIFSDFNLFCTDAHMADETILYFGEAERKLISGLKEGFLMADETLLKDFGRPSHLQIANPDSRWRHGAEAPLVGFRGAAHVMSILVNEMVRLNL